MAPPSWCIVLAVSVPFLSSSLSPFPPASGWGWCLAVSRCHCPWCPGRPVVWPGLHPRPSFVVVRPRTPLHPASSRWRRRWVLGCTGCPVPVVVVIVCLVGVGVGVVPCFFFGLASFSSLLLVALIVVSACAWVWVWVCCLGAKKSK